MFYLFYWLKKKIYIYIVCLFSMMAFGNDSLEMDFSSNLNDISHVDEAFF